MKYVLIDSELQEIAVIYALTPCLAAEAVDVSFGDKDGWHYVETAGPLAGPGYEVFETARYAGESADAVRAKCSRIANVAKVVDWAKRQRIGEGVVFGR